MTKHLYADTERPRSRVATDECDVELAGQRAESACEPIEPDLVCLRQRES